MEKQAHILVVDDEFGIREGCKRALSIEGYIVEGAEDGNIGLQMVKKSGYDLLLVDLMMPGIGGLDLIKKVHEVNPQIIIIVITGFATIETAVEATKRGAYDYLPKPFTPEALAGVVKRGLEKRALRLEAMELYAEREQRLLELANEKSRIRTIIGCMADGVLVTNLEEQLVLWNASAVKMLNLTGTETPGATLDHYIKNQEIIDSIQKVLTSNDDGFSRISHEIGVDDNGTVLKAHIAPVRDEENRILGAVTVLGDISELKKIDRIKSQFVSMVAHELRAPLAAIEGWLAVVLSGEGGGDQEQHRKWLERAKERARSLLSLVNDLLIVNRMDAGKVAQKMKPVQISEIIQNIVEFHEQDAKERGINIEINLPKTLSCVQADVNDMERLFTNLVNNAIKYNVENGSIEIEGSEDESFICICVKDTGIGISKQNAAHVFDDFYRADDERIKKIIGTGLGLTISKKIVDSHFGRIEVESEVGRGSIFSVFLPRTNIKN